VSSITQKPAKPEKEASSHTGIQYLESIFINSQIRKTHWYSKYQYQQHQKEQSVIPTVV